MSAEVRISPGVQESLRCPICRSRLRRDADAEFCCIGADCGARFPIVDGVPVLLNEASSVFSIEDFASGRKVLFSGSKPGLKGAVRRLFTPSISLNVKARANYLHLADRLAEQSSSPRVLVVGGAAMGQGMEALTENPRLELVETDVSFGERTMLICDAHDVPFDDASFDGVVVQAVLEHVADPHRCVEEIHRVLKDRGIVYAETPFMQQVHGGRYDFTRFTHLGHRRLFRRFEEIDSGAVCGPGMSLAWAYRHFLLCFAKPGKLSASIEMFASLTSFYLKYFDRWLVDTPAGIDGASGCYFLGRKSDRVLGDRELIEQYKGAG
ncbi:methyltransferase domain-containing protein [Candidatus Sumerlaeota bacterium]|nr:methyltransferase domain-containing protein [Candidatus Sumerlaeota bacterium]